MPDDTMVGMQLVEIHDFLKAELQSFSSAELLERTGVDVENSHSIFLSLTGDASKIIREKDGKWRWASKYPVRNFNQLLTLMCRSTDGVNERDLYDSYKGVKDDLKKLKKKGAMYEIKSGSKTLLFPRDDRYQLTISDEVKEKYKRVTVPDAIEVHRYLVQRGLKETDDSAGIKIDAPVSRKRPSSRKDTKRRRNKRIKLTNTHMENSGIDLSKDYNTGKESAFG
ncbi:unnamed protein product [Chondrus crispus]|uniref:TFA2 Winged helix domain-containing protein n=1 Tax=Chondrus crispus TaxID=2769 RepID=R7QDE6_CHOCR|nr:unnamed protein product [Chondrus crispus]CDF36517.1 unnamed protein product [Chondrus crispus]|eukprot:XP_005716336.1 unnamed protein product [Chondrus crispus]